LNRYPIAPSSSDIISQLEEGPQSKEVDLGAGEGAAKVPRAKGMLAMKYRILLELSWFFGAAVTSGGVKGAFVYYRAKIEASGMLSVP
jgi:hypothetical protein